MLYKALINQVEQNEHTSIEFDAEKWHLWFPDALGLFCFGQKMKHDKISRPV